MIQQYSIELNQAEALKLKAESKCETESQIPVISEALQINAKERRKSGRLLIKSSETDESASNQVKVENTNQSKEPPKATGKDQHVQFLHL
jgi:hypothetical protein